jgi:hypothetical protein
MDLRLQLFTWRREARLRSGALEDAEPLFVPAVVDGSGSTQVRQPENRSAALQSSVELEINGIIVRIGRLRSKDARWTKKHGKSLYG